MKITIVDTSDSVYWKFEFFVARNRGAVDEDETRSEDGEDGEDAKRTKKTH